MANVGIDLGTTCSVIGTPSHFEGKFFENVGGVTIIKDEYNQRILPSVVAADRDGNILVGRRAKVRAGMTPEPVMFVKRSMGLDKSFQIAGRTYMPEEVSAQVLIHLKEIAEKQMGETVEEAVITVPAYFSTLQIQKTVEAGEIAGLRVGRIVQEPVAAAIGYCYTDERDPLTIMTYDLGGGTFDVAIVRKEDGVFDIRSYDGDHFMGGCDFDKRLALDLIEKLKKQCFQVNIEPGSAQWYKMMVFAETVKTKLSDRESYHFFEQNTGLIAEDGEPIVFDMNVTRREFEELIFGDVEKTIQCCRDAVDKVTPKITYKDLDEIVMVGGSSRIPLVAQRLESEFGVKPKLIEPELSVAIGASIMANRLPVRIGSLQLDYIPADTDRKRIQVTGQLNSSEQCPKISGCGVILTLPGGETLHQEVREDGGFLFSRIILEQNTKNRFRLQVEDPEGRELAAHSFEVVHRTGETSSEVIGPPNILAKPISIMTYSGLYLIAPERTPLPYRKSLPANTMDQKGIVHIAVYEGNVAIGEIVIDNVPTDLPVGSRVEITLDFRDDFFIEGKAVIPRAGVAGQTTIRITPVKVKTREQLYDRFLELEKKAEEALDQADRGQAFRIGRPLHATLKEAREILTEDKAPNLAKAQEQLDEAETLIGKLSGWTPKPSLDRFQMVEREIEDQLIPSLPKPDQNGFIEQLRAIAGIAYNALDEKDDLRWKDANNRLSELRGRIADRLAPKAEEKPGGGGGRDSKPEPPPEPRQIKLKLGIQLTQLREDAKRKDRYRELEKDFQDCSRSLQAIDPEAADAMNRIYDYYENQHQPLIAKVTAVTGIETDDHIGRVKVLEPQGGEKKSD